MDHRTLLHKRQQQLNLSNMHLQALTLPEAERLVMGLKPFDVEDVSFSVSCSVLQCAGP